MKRRDLYPFASKGTRRRKLQEHLIDMEWELKARLNPENKYGYMKGVHYFRDQIKKTRKLLGIK